VERQGINAEQQFIKNRYFFDEQVDLLRGCLERIDEALDFRDLLWHFNGKRGDYNAAANDPYCFGHSPNIWAPYGAVSDCHKV